MDKKVSQISLHYLAEPSEEIAHQLNESTSEEDISRVFPCSGASAEDLRSSYARMSEMAAQLKAKKESNHGGN